MSAITPIHGPSAPAPPDPGAATPVTPRAAPPAPAAAAAAPAVDPETLRQAVADLQRTIRAYAKEPREVVMRLDEAQNVTVVEVRERDTGDLILQYPPEKILNVRDRLDELIGAMIDRKG